MNSEKPKTQENFDTEISKSFHDFLRERAEKYGFGESKKLDWIKYMADPSRGEKNVESVLSNFNMTIKEGDRALDIGCGFGGLLIALQQHFDQVCGIELWDERAQWARKRAPKSEVVCGNAKKLPWADEWFDLVLSTDVFEHISFEEQEVVASELMRVLKPGGHVFITVPSRFQILDEHNRVFFGTWLPNSLREKYVKTVSSNKGYVRCWERTGKGWKNLFEAQGFQVTLKPIKHKSISFFPTSRYQIYLTK